jgi:hypothetical protein
VGNGLALMGSGKGQQAIKGPSKYSDGREMTKAIPGAAPKGNRRHW